MRLVADIGGTNVRFSLVNDNKEISDYKKFLKIDFENVTEAIKYYLSTLKVKPVDAVMAINTAVINNVPKMDTENYWGYNSETILEDTGLENITYINDLYSHAIAIPHLENISQYKVFGGEPEKKGCVFVVGPGTGLGASYGNYNEDKKKIDFFPSEPGGEVISAVNPRHQKIVDAVWKIRPFVRWDEWTSGRGITLMYEALYGIKKSTDDIMKELHEGSEKSKEVFDYFCEFLAILIRNKASFLLSSGGIYIVGGILTRPENLELFKKSKFYDYYNYTLKENTTHIKDYPIYVITKPHLPFLGLANYKK